MISSKIFSGVWLTRKNYEMGKCNCCRNPASMFGRIPARPLPGFGEHVWSDSCWTPQDPIRSDRILAILARFDWIRPDPTRSGPDPGHFGQIRLDQCLDPSRSGRIPAILAKFGRINGRIWLDSAEFWPF
jgi:hypothetical protein